MPGQIKQMLDSVLQQRSNGNSVVLNTTKTKLILKGLNPDKFTLASPDDSAVISKVRAIAAELGVHI